MTEIFSRQLDWNLLKLFDEIVKAGGITSAAQEMRRKQPALSLALRRLEDRLGVVLCRRGPAGFELTDEGQLVAEICEKMGAAVQHLPNRIANLAEEVRGRVKIHVISSLVNPILDEAIASFHKRCPRVEIVMDVSTWDGVSRDLLRNEVDVGVAPARFHHAELRYDLLFREVHRPYCGRGHRLFGSAPSDPSTLADHAFVLTGADEPDQLTKYRLRHGLGRIVAGISEHLDEAKRLTLLGIGICFLPVGFAAPEVENGLLWPLMRPSDEPSMDIFVITNPNAPRHLARQLLLDEFWRCLRPRTAAAGEQPGFSRGRKRGAATGRPSARARKH